MATDQLEPYRSEQGQWRPWHGRPPKVRGQNSYVLLLDLMQLPDLPNSQVRPKGSSIVAGQTEGKLADVSNPQVRPKGSAELLPFNNPGTPLALNGEAVQLVGNGVPRPVAGRAEQLGSRGVQTYAQMRPFFAKILECDPGAVWDEARGVVLSSGEALPRVPAIRRYLKGRQP